MREIVRIYIICIYTWLFPKNANMNGNVLFCQPNKLHGKNFSLLEKYGLKSKNSKVMVTLVSTNKIEYLLFSQKKCHAT
jgi:hypothetical protein